MFYFCEKRSWDFDGDCTESVECLREYRHFNCPIHEHRIPLHLFVSLFSFNNGSFLSVQVFLPPWSNLFLDINVFLDIFNLFTTDSYLVGFTCFRATLEGGIVFVLC